MSSGAKYKDYEDKAKRELSFLNYPKPYPPKDDLVRAGFFYLGPGAGNDDDCQCYYCGVRLFNWTKEDDPLKEHEKFRPNCLVIKTIRSPSNVPPPMNIHPTENPKYPEPETKIYNTTQQTMYKPQEGTPRNTNTSFYTRPTGTMTTTFSKEDMYSIPQYGRNSESTKQQRYPIAQKSQDLESVRMETPVRHSDVFNYSSPQTSSLPTLLPGQIAYDNINQPTNISSSHQAYVMPQGRVPRESYYPQTQQSTFQTPQTLPEQGAYGDQHPPSQLLNTHTHQNHSFEQQNFQYPGDPSYGSSSYANNFTSYGNQELSPRPILNSGPFITRPENQNIQSVQTRYPANSSDFHAPKFPQQLGAPTGLVNPMQNYIQTPQITQYRYPQ